MVSIRMEGPENPEVPGALTPLLALSTPARTPTMEKTRAVISTAHHGTSGYKGAGGFGEIPCIAPDVDEFILFS